MDKRGRHHHDHDREAVHHKLDLIIQGLGAIGRRERKMAADITTIKQLVKDIDAETNTVASKVDEQTAAIKALQDQLAQGVPVTAQDLQDVQDGLTPISDRLKTIGASAAHPIPPPVV